VDEVVGSFLLFLVRFFYEPVVMKGVLFWLIRAIIVGVITFFFWGLGLLLYYGIDLGSCVGGRELGLVGVVMEGK
jgi:hypothetical protein